MTPTTSFVSERQRFESRAPVNAMTVDVEDYFQVSALESFYPKESWLQVACRIPANIDRILALFQQHDIRATFFILGWVAENHPEVVRAIASAGHELASHGLSHVRATEQNQAMFRDDVIRSKKLLEDVSGCGVHGYRAASFSINSSNLWALDELQAAGYRYSSSIYPVHHDLYGMPEAPRFPFRLASTRLLEIPVSTLRLAGRNLPCGGGGFFRLYPYSVSRWAIRQVNSKERQPAVFYFHPWELDIAQPRPDGLPAKTRFRHYLNLSRFESRLRRLLADFSWSSMDRVFNGV